MATKAESAKMPQTRRKYKKAQKRPKLDKQEWPKAKKQKKQGEMRKRTHSAKKKIGWVTVPNQITKGMGDPRRYRKPAYPRLWQTAKHESLGGSLENDGKNSKEKQYTIPSPERVPQ